MSVASICESVQLFRGQLTSATPPTRTRPMAAEDPKIWLAPPVKVAPVEEVGTAAPVPVGATPVAMAVVVPLETWEKKH